MKEFVMFFVTLIVTTFYWLLYLKRNDIIDFNNGFIVPLALIAFSGLLYIAYRILINVIDKWDD